MAGDIIAPGVWLNCTDPKSPCESTGWIFGGVPGVCNHTTNLCDCPTGYSGGDDFILYNDCHVVESIRTYVRVVVLICALGSLVLSLYFALRMVVKWGLFYYVEQIDEDDPSQAKQSGGSVVGRKETSNLGSTPLKHVGSADSLVLVPGNGVGLKTVGSAQSFEALQLMPSPQPPAAPESSPTAEAAEETVFSAAAAAAASTQPNALELTPSAGSGTPTLPPDYNVRASIAAAKRRSVMQDTLKRLPRPSTAAILDLAPIGHSKFGPNAKAKSQERRWKRWMILIVLEFTCCNAMIIPYEAILLVGARSYRSADNGIGFCLASIFTLLFWGLWTICYVWFRNLPNLKSYGKMFHVDSVLWRHPHLVKHLFWTHVIVTGLFSYGFLLVFPAIWPQHLYAFQSVMFYFIFFFVIDFGVIFSLICLLLLKVFSLLDTQIGVRNNNVNEGDSAARQAKSTIRFALCLAAFAVPIAIGAGGSLLWAPYARSNLWIFSQLIGALFLLLCDTILYVIVFRNTGSNSAKSREQAAAPGGSS